MGVRVITGLDKVFALSCSLGLCIALTLPARAES